MSNACYNIKPKNNTCINHHLPNVAQVQKLNGITKEQLELLPKEQRSNSCVAMLGIINGNGLEHITSCGITKVIG